MKNSNLNIKNIMELQKDQLIQICIINYVLIVIYIFLKLNGIVQNAQNNKYLKEIMELKWI